MSLFDNFIRLYKAGKELALLQRAYLVLSLLSFLVAGVIALFNQSLGLAFLVVPFAAFIAFSLNILAWALVRLAVEGLAEKEQKPEKTPLKENKTKGKK